MDSVIGSKTIKLLNYQFILYIKIKFLVRF